MPLSGMKFVLVQPMRTCLTIVSLFWLLTVGAQSPRIEIHPNTGMLAISINDSLITDYIYTEMSEFAEGKAYAAKGELYAYIDEQGNELTPYIFTVANDFSNGFAIVGDSFSLGLINDRMQVVVPFRFNRVIPPKLGLVVLQSKQGYWGAYDIKGNERIPFLYDLPPVYDHLDYIVVRKELLYGVVNDCHETRYNTSYQYISKQGMAYRSGVGLRLFNLP